MTAGATSDLGRARALEQRLRHRLRLHPGTSSTGSPKIRWPTSSLFARRATANTFASAMAVMLRSLNIPARLATGFQMGIYNPISDLWLVRASDAHSWVEAWIPGRGWTTFDPTPPDLSSHSLTLFSKAELYLDAAETFWQQWVVGYDPNHQGTLADRIEQTARRLGIGWFDSLSGVESALGRAGQGLDPAVRDGSVAWGCWWRFGCGRAARGCGARCGFAAVWSGCEGERGAERMPLCSTSACCRCSGGKDTKTGLVHAPGIRTIAAGDAYRSRGGGVHRRLQRRALRRPQGSGAAVVGSAG
jgi:hypothetical protein